MPDVVVIGGGIIGAASAFELARRGASVTLLERDELAAGASGRNLGYLDTSKDAVLAPLARRSLERYLEIAEEPPTPVLIDREPIGTIALTVDADEVVDVHAWAEAARAVGVAAERLDSTGLHELEPSVANVLEAYRMDEGRRVDPTALTICLAALARSHGARIEHHRSARRLHVDGDRVAGVVTDDGVVHADTVVLAAGPWSGAIVRPLGIRLPVHGARGWLVQTAPDRPLVHHWIQSGARRLHRGAEPRYASAPGPLAVTVRGFADAGEARDVSPVLQPAPDGSLLLGTSREPSLATDVMDVEVARAVARAATRIVPALADAPVVATWSGVRPVSPDERPILGWLADGLCAATGHGSEGVILGAGSAELVAQIVLGEEPWLDPAPFDPRRFERPARP